VWQSTGNPTVRDIKRHFFLLKQQGMKSPQKYRNSWIRPVLRIRMCLNADPDREICLNADPDTEIYLNADPDSGFWILDPD